MTISPENLAIYERARDEAVAAARAAGLLMNARVGQLSADDIRFKGAHDLVTVLDLEVQNLIVERLGKAFPDHQFLAEEGELSAVESPESGFRWIIDPIDGTTNFSRAAPPYAISIGLQHGKDVVVGVILEPSRGDLYVAVKSRGLYLNGERVQVSRTPSLSQSIVATGFPYRSIDHLEPFLEVLASFIKRCHGFRRMGSAAIDLAYVAVGRFDAFYEVGLSAWDMAAGRLLVEEGGGRVTSLSGEAHSLFEGAILASNGRVHEEMLPLVRPLMESHRAAGRFENS